MVETELLQPVVRLVEQQRAEQLGSVDICGLQSTLNVQQATAESISVPQQKAEAVDFHCVQNLVDVQIPFWQRKAGELCPADFHSLQSMLDAQRDKIHQQLLELQKVVVLQCRITGTNPLAQEMAAAVLEKRIGKRFGESLTPKALKCLYNVFSIKDTITKKEAREISALCGATVTQVREFFAGQRSRVRKVVQSSHVDRGSDDMFLKLQSTELDQSAIVLHCGEDTSSLSSQQVESRQCNHLLLLDAFHGREDGISSKLHAVEKAEYLINVMHKESTFTGQSQLAQVIMQAHESVLRCFMARGGLQQINKWLIQAAAEEQTSLIRVMLKAITQLPLGSALPRHMSLLLQTVNKLRFYRAQDIASRARLLLSRWSRFFKSSQGSKAGSFTGVARTAHPGQKRTRDSAHSRAVDDVSKKKVKADIMVESGQSSDLVSSSLTEDKTMQEREKPEAVIEINRTKKRLGSFLIQGDRAKEKRKVQLFEASQAAIRRKDVEGTRSSSFESSSRPLSADDIKKAKRRAYFLAKSQEPSSSRSDGSTTLGLQSFSAEGGQRKTVKSAGYHGGVHEPMLGDNCFDGTSIEGSHSETVPKLRINPKVSDILAGQRADLPMSMDGKALNVVNKSVQNNAEVHRLAEVQGASGLELNGFELSMGVKQSELCEDADTMDMPSIPWTTPPRVALDPRWKTASGEHSTEVESESKRLRNELEAIYLSPQCIPPNPEEPAERLCLFVDDTLVPEILLEALDEESQEKDCSLQSPRESSKVRGEEADSQKSIANIDCKAHEVHCKAHEVLCSSRNGIDRFATLVMPFRESHTPELMTTKDQQSSLVSETTELNCNKPVKKVNSATDPTKNFYVDPSELTLATPVEQACMEPRKTGYCNPQAYQQGGGTIQLKNREAAPVCREPTLFEPYKASAVEPLPNTVWKKDITSSLQNDCDKASSSLAANAEVPLLLDHFANAGSDNNTSAVDLSELSKEDCMDMLNIVLQQLTDNAKASGADLELLSVFLKNPQLVYSLMSSSGKGFSSASTGRHLSEIMAGNTIEDLNNQLEKLVGRNIGQVANTGNELEKARPHTSQFIQPVRPPIAMAGPQSHPLLPPSMPRSLAVVDSQIQLPNKESKVFDGTQFLKHPFAKADISSNSSDYDWSQPYDHPANCIQQGAGLARHSMHTSKTVDNCPSISAYSQSPPVYTQSHLARASQSQNMLTQTDQRLHSSMLMYDCGPVHMNATTLHAERDGRVAGRRNGFPVVDAPHARLLQTGAGISDGILPVPDITSTSLRVHPMHETQTLHGGKVPAFVPDVRGGPAVVGNQMPPYLSNGHHYGDQNFRPQSAPSPRPPYVPHGHPPPSFLMNSMRPQGNSILWRPPPSRSNHSRHFRPGWREE